MANASVILFANKRSAKEIEQIIQLVRDNSQADLTIIGDSSLDGQLCGNTLIPTDYRNLSTCLNEAIAVIQSHNVLLLDARLPISANQIKDLIERTANLDQDNQRMMYIPIDLIDEDYDIGSLDPEAMINIITREGDWPVMVVGCTKEYAFQVAKEDSDSSSELMARLFVLALSEGTPVERTDDSIRPSDDVVAQLPGKFTQLGQARLLGMIINSFAIEDLYPNMPWGDYSQESAASAYHSLAALFIRLEDSRSATECLRLSDKFQESPRSWALRGIIASNKGETLGAVANLVSSLQQYEEKKKEEKGYIKFSPSNLEIINSSLVTGLDALNRRDNEKALDCFAEAVFNFDNFYEQFKLTRSRHNT